MKNPALKRQRRALYGFGDRDGSKRESYPVEAAANAVKRRETIKIKDFYVHSDNF